MTKTNETEERTETIRAAIRHGSICHCQNECKGHTDTGAKADTALDALIRDISVLQTALQNACEEIAGERTNRRMLGTGKRPPTKADTVASEYLALAREKQT